MTMHATERIFQKLLNHFKIFQGQVVSHKIISTVYNRAQMSNLQLYLNLNLFSWTYINLVPVLEKDSTKTTQLKKNRIWDTLTYEYRCKNSKWNFNKSISVLNKNENIPHDQTELFQECKDNSALGNLSI